MFRYLDAEVFRFNHRKLNDGERMIHATMGMAGKRLTYKQLINTPPLEFFAAGSVNGAADADRLN